MERIARIIRWIGKLKYLWVVLIFLSVVSVLDENSLYKRHQRQATIESYKEEINKYKQQYERETAMLESIDSSHYTLEKIAREKYMMQRPNEDIFIIEEE